MASQALSIYLLKSEFDATNSLEAGHGLVEDKASKIPPGSVLYLAENQFQPPRWKEYLGVTRNLRQTLHGALLFIEGTKRNFALCFGHTYHKLKKESYEYDFGLRITLNCVDEKKLRSTDTLEPSSARRQRVQAPSAAELTYFDLDEGSTIYRSLTGKVEDKYKDLFSQATGASNIKIRSKIAPDKLVKLCDDLLGIYERDDYVTKFPFIRYIEPVRDPEVVGALDNILLDKIRLRDDRVMLSFPEILDTKDHLVFWFSGGSPRVTAKEYEFVDLEQYYEYLTAKGLDLSKITRKDLHDHCLCVGVVDGGKRDQTPVYKTLLADAELPKDNRIYHLREGEWYRIEKGLLDQISSRLEGRIRDVSWPSFDHDDEGSYNTSLPTTLPNLVCLDKSDISLKGQKQVEPCDLAGATTAGTVALYHVKRSTRSSGLSHLFNQGINSVVMLRTEQESKAKMLKLVKDAASAPVASDIEAALAKEEYEVFFLIVSHRDSTSEWRNLPIFSQISLMRAVKTLDTMKIPAWYGFIKDDREKPKSKQRKRQAKKAA